MTKSFKKIHWLIFSPLSSFSNNKYPGHPRWLSGKESACQAGDPDSIPGWEDPLEKEIATHSSVLAWEIPWTEEPGGLQSMGVTKESDTI